MLVDASNVFNEMNRLEILWTVQHHWPAGARFTLNFCKHWVQLLLRQLGEPPVTLLSMEGETKGDPLLMFLYSITLVLLV